MYTPCWECLNRYGRQYSKECDDTCEYANEVKLKDIRIEELSEKLRQRNCQIAELEVKLAYTNEMLSKAYQIIGEVIER